MTSSFTCFDKCSLRCVEIGGSSAAVGGGLPRRYLARLIIKMNRRALEQAASPASYPTTSTRWLMNLAANARTDFCKSMSTVARSDEFQNEIYANARVISSTLIVKK